MKYVNLWQVLYQAAYLVAGFGWLLEKSELARALAMCQHSPALVLDIGLFCLCASVGQVLIFNVIQEFGSLSWITISVTRKLFTVVLSVVLFRHPVRALQWLGVALVFVGLALDAGMSYHHSRPKAGTKGGKAD